MFFNAANKHLCAAEKGAALCSMMYNPFLRQPNREHRFPLWVRALVTVDDQHVQVCQTETLILFSCCSGSVSCLHYTFHLGLS